MAKDVGDRIRLVMKELGINDPELGELTGTSKQAVGRWKHGIAKPRAEALAMLKEKRGVSETWILYGKGEMFVTRPDPFVKAMTEYCGRMTAEQKKMILDLAAQFATREPQQPPEG